MWRCSSPRSAPRTCANCGPRYSGRERRLAKFRQNVARFRLYRLRFLQENMRFAAFFKIYQILKLKFLKIDKILQILRHLQFFLLKFHENCWFFKPIFCENIFALATDFFFKRGRSKYLQNRVLTGGTVFSLIWKAGCTTAITVKRQGKKGYLTRGTYVDISKLY